MSKYDGLYKWLMAKKIRVIPSDFVQIEKILGFTLPASARQYREWWANETARTRNVHCPSWIDAGFHTKDVNLKEETLLFVRVV
jgi:hypothetical protein